MVLLESYQVQLPDKTGVSHLIINKCVKTVVSLTLKAARVVESRVKGEIQVIAAAQCQCVFEVI